MRSPLIIDDTAYTRRITPPHVKVFWRKLAHEQNFERRLLKPPLAQKLGFKSACRVLAIGEPPQYRELLEPLPEGVLFENKPGPSLDFVHLFATEREDLAKELTALREELKAEVAVWVSWPKKSSKVPTSISEDTIREVALPMGFVDVEVCAFSDVWSGLKLFVRKELR